LDHLSAENFEKRCKRRSDWPEIRRGTLLLIFEADLARWKVQSTLIVQKDIVYMVAQL